MRHIALIFIALVCASCSESKEDLRDKICDLQNQVSELQEQLSEKDERIEELEEKLSNIQSYASDAESTMDNIHSYGNRFGDIDDQKMPSPQLRTKLTIEYDVRPQK